VWCNLDIARRNVEQVFRQMIRPHGLTVIEWHILRSLYKQDGQHASELARTVGRAATSFTPNLDKLQNKGLIERRADDTDRRAVRIYLTKSAHDHRDEVTKSAKDLDKMIATLFPDEEYESFKKVLATLQSVAPEEFSVN
jgi:MarR family transcriptional regulator for hemolysin